MLCVRLWLAAGLLAAFIGTLVIGNFFTSADKSVQRHMLGHDFTAFYAAGHFADIEQFDKLYDIESIKRFEQETGKRFNLSLGDSYGPYWNPPFYAWVFAGLSRLPYGEALFAWTLINLGCLAGAVLLLCRMLPRQAGWRHRALVPCLLLLSMPVMQAFSHGQNTCSSLLLLSITVTFWRRGNGWLSGLVGGLLFYKPQLGAIVALALVLDLGITALAGLTFTGLCLVGISMLTMPGAVGAFVHQLPANVRFMQVDHAYVWERHATLKAFWRLLFQGRGAGEPKLIVTLLSGAGVVLLGSGLVYAALRTVSVPSLGMMLYGSKDSAAFDPRRRDRLITATIVTMPLLMPFYFDYDLMLLAIPATLFAAEKIRGSTGDAWLVRAWIALFLWTLINPGLAGATRVNLTVPLLTCVAGMSIARAIRVREREQGIRIEPRRLAA